MPSNSEQFQELLQHLGITRVVCVDDRYASRFDVAEIVAWAPGHAMHPRLTEAALGFDCKSETGSAELRTYLEDAANQSIAIELQATIEREKLKPNAAPLGEDARQL